MTRSGRKLKLLIEPKLLDEVCRLLAEGCAVRTVCQITGLSESSFFRWSDAGNPESPSHDPRFSEFWQATTRARGMGKAELVRLVTKDARRPGNGHLALALLARLSPEEYGRARAERVADEDGEFAASLISEIRVRVSGPDKWWIEERAKNPKVVNMVEVIGPDGDRSNTGAQE